jgi:hypothetical protein
MLTEEELDEIVKNMKNRTLPSETICYKIIRQARDVLFQEKNNLDISGQIHVVGDIHGQFYDLLNMLN